MPRYENGTLGKLTVQDWDVVATYPDEKYLYELTPQQAAALIALCPPMNWRTRWKNPPDNDTLKAFVADTVYNLMNPLTFDCDDVTDCIENNPGTQIAIENVTQQQQNGQNPLSQNTVGSNLLGGVYGCALPNLWGAMRTLVEWLNGNNEQFLDELSTATTPAARGAALSDNIPGINLGALGEALSAGITFLSSALVNGYDAYYDQSYADELACELFCIAQDNCELSIEQLYLVLSARVGFTPAADAFYNGLLLVITGSWTGSQFADVMMFVQVAAFRWMGGFANYTGINPLSNALSLGFDDPSDDYLTLCACPDLWVYTLDSATLPVWVTFPDAGWGAISGISITQTTATAFGQDVTGIFIEIEFPTIQTISTLSIKQVAGANIEGSTLVNAFYAYLNAGDQPLQPVDNGLRVQNGEWEFAYGETIPGVKKIVMQYLFIGTNQTMEWNVTIAGRGTNPFV